VNEALSIEVSELAEAHIRVTVDRMELIEAEFNDGVLRPMRSLPLRPGERVGIVVVRRPDPLRWDLARLAKVNPEEVSLTEAGLAEWDAALSREDRS
jgi:predicted DNA-binding antitoxin AbrB/MazE fold protein